MRPAAWLVNLGRGSLLDTDALVAALEAGRLALPPGSRRRAVGGRRALVGVVDVDAGY